MLRSAMRAWRISWPFPAFMCRFLSGYWRFFSRNGTVFCVMMNLYLSAAEYDYHTLLKVAEMAGLAGIIGFHEAGDGYLVTFPQGENVQALIDDYKGRLRDLENNIWQH